MKENNMSTRCLTISQVNVTFYRIAKSRTDMGRESIKECTRSSGQIHYLIR
jgi:hypothetical protein